MTVEGAASGRPFRFLCLVLCLWFVSRAAAWIAGVFATTGTVVSMSASAYSRPAAGLHKPRPVPVWSGASVPAPSIPKGSPLVWHGQDAKALLAPDRPPESPDANPAAEPAHRARGIFDAPLEGSIAHFPPDSAVQTKRDRWLLSAWMLYRSDKSEARFANAGQLGGSQAGTRLAYELMPSGRFALAIHGRVSTALEAPAQAEGAVGLTFRPVRAVPVALAVERRFNIGEGGRDALAVYLSGGFDAVPLPAGLQAEGYAQAGFVGASRRDAFADGRITLFRPLVADGDERLIAAGFAVSGGAQPSLARLDIGPQMSVRFPLGQGHARLAVEWRERVAGNARPSSGPAVILASDF